MPRSPKHPDHKVQAEKLMNGLLDDIVDIWTSEEEPELKTVAEEVELSPAKIRKLLITAAERDHTRYYSSTVADSILRMRYEGKSVAEIQEKMGLSYTSVHGYLPHSKSVYSLDALSAEAERIKVYRARKKAVAELQDNMGLPDELAFLWKAVIAFEGYIFSTSGRGKNKAGATKFRYTITRSAGAGGRHYDGDCIEGYGNEVFIDGKEKSISRSTVDLAYRKAREMNGKVKGPKALGIPGAGSYLYPMLIRFGVIKGE